MDRAPIFTSRVLRSSTRAIAKPSRFDYNFRDLDWELSRTLAGETPAILAARLGAAKWHGCPRRSSANKLTARLIQNDDAKIILANAAQHVGQSVMIWLAAADLEHDVKATERSMYYDELFNTFQTRAVEVIPLSVELWLALARLETPEKAIGVLNKARKAVPTSQNIGLPQGVCGRTLVLEATEELERVDKTLAIAVRTSRAHGILLTREKWLTEAERCEAEGSGRVGTAGAVLAFALRVFPDRPDFWRRTADLEKAHGTHESLDKPACACRRVLPLGGSPVQWLMWAKGKWLGGDVRAAREVLERAFVRNSESEQIWLAAVKLEAENGELAVARELLIWLKSAVFERQQGQSDLALKTVTTALSKYPKFAKLYMVQGQIHQAANKHSAARAAYAAGIKAVPKDFTLRVLASRLEEADGKSIRARALLEKARLVNPKSDVLWAGRGAFRRPLRGRRCLRAARMPNIRHALVNGNLVARLYWADRRIEEAREWFERAVSAGPDLGDAWGWWLKFERKHETAAQQEDVIVRCQAAEPRHGETWQPIAKDDKNGGKSAKEIPELVAVALQ
ncbi:hypothetical protein F5888DRAFT_1844101 [Russula emetica]|nr:hypothetical protein F5888DRAFT_1844101 [Russula emetica]